MKYLLSVFLGLASTASIQAQYAPHAFVINAEKPYTYVQFDHIGRANHSEALKGALGLWLRVFNNSRVTLTMKCTGENPDGSNNTEDEVLPSDLAISPMFVGTTDELEKKRQEQRLAQIHAAKRPHGYSFEVSGECRIPPSKSLLLQFPRNHVDKDWFLRLRVFLDVSAPRAGTQPPTILDFTEYDIPKESR